MQINDIVVSGRLVDDVDYSSTKNGSPMATFKIANNRGKIVNYFRIASFGKTADYAHKYLKKSQRLNVQGVLNHHEQHAKDGWHDYYTIIANTFDPVSRRKQSKSTRDLYSKIDSLTSKVDKVSKATGSVK